MRNGRDNASGHAAHNAAHNKPRPPDQDQDQDQDQDVRCLGREIGVLDPPEYLANAARSRFTPCGKRIEWRQLYAMARDHLKRDPTLDDGEWAERIKRQVVAMHRPYPRPDEITAAMRAAERGLRAQGVDRAPAIAPLSSPPAPQQGGLTHEEAVRALAQLGATAVLKPMKPARVPTRRVAECQKAARILAQGILEQIARCEAAEREEP